MKEEAVLVFRPDGRAVGLYTELIDLSAIGNLTIQRASNIEFDNRLQAWRVKDMKGFAMFTAPTRQQCVDWEKLHFAWIAENMAG